MSETPATNPTQSSGGTMNQPDTAVSVLDEVVAPKGLNFSDLIESEASLYTLRTRLMLTLSPRVHDQLPAVVSIGDANFSFDSPLKQGDGSLSKPHGIIREALKNLTEYLGELSRAANVTLIGDSETIERTVKSFTDRVTSEVNPILLAFNNGSETFSVPRNLLKVETNDELPSDVEEGEDLDPNDASPVEFSVFNEVLNVTVWPTVLDNSIIEIVVSVNVVCPMLVDKTDLDAFTLIHNIVSRYAAENGVGAENYNTALILDSDQLLTPSTRGILEGLSQPGVEANVIGAQYFYDCALEGADPYGLYPNDKTAPDAINDVFAFGGDILVVAQTLPKKEASPKKSAPETAPKKLLKKKFKKV